MELTAIEYALRRRITKLEDYISELEAAVTRSGEVRANEIRQERKKFFDEINDLLLDANEYGALSLVNLVFEDEFEEEFLCT